MGHPWNRTAALVARVKALTESGRTAEQIGAEIGRTKAATWAFMQRHGIRSCVDKKAHPIVMSALNAGRAARAENCQKLEAERAEVIAEMVAKGMRNCEIAAATGIHHGAITRIQKSFGIQRHRLACVRDRSGRKDRSVRRNYARAHGLPDSLTPRQVDVVYALLDRPMTKRELRDRLGTTVIGTMQPNLPSGRPGHRTMLGDLMGRGLVFKGIGLPNEVGHRGPRRRLYMLTRKALLMIENNPTVQEYRRGQEQRQRQGQGADPGGSA